jgi:hypothetical protein
MVEISVLNQKICFLMVDPKKKVIPTFEIVKDVTQQLDQLDSGSQTFYVMQLWKK